MLKKASVAAFCLISGSIGAVAFGTMALADDAPRDLRLGIAGDAQGLNGFASKSDLDAFIKRMADLEAAMVRHSEGVLYADGGSPVEQESVAEAENESITNTQEAGVDEGGIVKNVGDYLVVLRRGRLFTVRTGGGALEPIDTANAFPPGKENPGNTWYDEMLVRGNQVIVIGYSYGDFGTEINRFDISDYGKFTYRDTHYMRSGDYYSSSNYASRLIGDELIFYTPVYANWSNFDASLPSIREMGEEAGDDLVAPEDFLVAAPYRSGNFPLNVLHTVTRCDVAGEEFDCSATAIAGTWSHAFYVSRDAVYAWTGVVRSGWEAGSTSTPGQLYRIPLDGSRPGAVQVAGSPIDQFSFAEDAQGGVLRVLLRAVGNGDGMWSSEYSAGDVSLASVPFDAFGSGGGMLVRGHYRKLPEPEGWRLHNRFVGDYLLYAAGGYGREDETAMVYAVPLNGGAVQEVAMPHGVTRFDKIGKDGIVVGPSSDGALGFSSLKLAAKATLEDTYFLASAGEGETRSQAFFFKPDRGSADGLSGTLGLPITRQLRRDGSEFLGSGSAIAFLRRDERKLSKAGELAARTQDAVDDNCIASCVDWYGNARPIFMGNRIFALMGYEIVEGTMAGGQIKEARRVSFAPPS